jgi:hypothetical protein
VKEVKVLMNGDANTIWHEDLAPADFQDPVIEAYKKDIDRTLLRENLKLTADGRFRKHESFMKFFFAMREAGRRNRTGQ